MIIDRIENLSRYALLLPQLNTIISLIEGGTLHTLPLGSYTTDDPSLRYVIMRYETVLEEPELYEIHRRDADVQILLSGRERMDVADREGFVTTVEYDQSKDALFGTGRKTVSYHADTSHFVLFFAGEPHAPNLIDSEERAVKKVVFKIIV